MAPNASDSDHGDQCPVENGSEDRKDSDSHELGLSRPPTRLEQKRLKRVQSDGAALSSEISRLSLNSEAEQVIVQCQCECCGLSEECTAGYIGRVRKLFCDRWICGLCAEAVKEERNRMDLETPMEAALQAHISVCKKFNKYERTNPAVHVADAMCKLLKKSREASTSKPNVPAIPRGNLGRSTSCIPSMARDFK